MEIWKDIRGYEGIYQASDLGRIRTVEGKVTHSVRHGIRHWHSKILKYRGHNPQTGHRVSLWKNKKSKDYLVARLIAFTFFDKDIKNRKLTVNHIDGNRFNNKIDNLELISLKKNIQHAFKEGLMPTRKITIEDQFGKRYNFISLSECCRFLNRKHSYIYGRLKKGTYQIINSKGDVFNIIKIYELRKEHKGTI